MAPYHLHLHIGISLASTSMSSTTERVVSELATNSIFLPSMTKPVRVINIRVHVNVWNVVVYHQIEGLLWYVLSEFHTHSFLWYAR